LRGIGRDFANFFTKRAKKRRIDLGFSKKSYLCALILAG
jgi:hypothetical protein